MQKYLTSEAPSWLLSGFGEANIHSYFRGDISFEESRWNYYEFGEQHHVREKKH